MGRVFISIQNVLKITNLNRCLIQSYKYTTFIVSPYALNPRAYFVTFKQ